MMNERPDPPRPRAPAAQWSTIETLDDLRVIAEEGFSNPTPLEWNEIRFVMDGIRHVTNQLAQKEKNKMPTQNIFEYATRSQLRFASIRGELSIEQLWHVPLRSRDDFNLDVIAKTANKALKEISEESFVETSKTAEHTRREAALEILRYIIDTKLTEEKAAATRAEKKQEKAKLLRILAEKQDGKLSALSEQELQNRIAALED